MPTESFRTNGTVLVTASVNGYFRIQGRVMRNYFVFRPSAPPSNFVTPTVVKQLVNLRSKSVLSWSSQKAHCDLSENSCEGRWIRCGTRTTSVFCS